MLTKPDPGMPATVVLPDGRSVPLRFPLRALKALKQDHQIDMLRNGAALGDLLSDPGSLAVILAAGLQGADPSLTVEWVEDNIEVSMLTDIAPALLYAATGRWFDLSTAAAENGRGNGTASDSSSLQTGSASGPSDATTSGSPNPTSGS